VIRAQKKSVLLQDLGIFGDFVQGCARAEGRERRFGGIVPREMGLKMAVFGRLGANFFVFFGLIDGWTEELQDQGEGMTKEAKRIRRRPGLAVSEFVFPHRRRREVFAIKRDGGISFRLTGEGGMAFRPTKNSSPCRQAGLWGWSRWLAG